ncbi:MAG TPA: magnesium-translocating P-type ATPase, partial [Gemmatimonadaceae bacterium]|nr:magnesium-translocating P-type ATPase [Gemmatimonadaceae bacterium]
VNQASLTGESLPVEKMEVPRGPVGDSLLSHPAICFLGTSVSSGTATGVVVCTGRDTYFGSMAGVVTEAPEETAFDRGIAGFTWLMIRLIVIMVPLVFLINGLSGHGWRDAFFFALAVAVGLTPEMLPMIVSVCLSKGAVAMSRKKVIVKRLAAIQSVGGMDVLCTDKTGTLTMDHVILERHCDVQGNESDRVLLQAVLISHFQTGLRNLLDRAILARAEQEGVSTAGYAKVDELPFDFERKLMSVFINEPDGTHRLLAKGAPEAIFARCTSFEVEGVVRPIEQAFLDELREEYESLSNDGFRVLAVAGRTVSPSTHYTVADEHDLTLIGYVAFLDPPRDSAAPAIAALRRHGIAVKILTGDNELVTGAVCRQVGLPMEPITLGPDIERMSDDDLARAVGQGTIFARLSPAHKQRIIRVLQQRGHVVGFLGDGINDAPALHAADVGISVDSAVDIAKESADIILLEKSLMVLDEGVTEGRKVFANIRKYIRMGASSNFGNMFSVLGASALLPFVPMAPVQVLTNNLLYDFSQVAIPTDDVDADEVARPLPWDIGKLRRFILLVGPLSSIFDYTTFAIMWFVFGARDIAHASLFQTGWFVESLMTQTLIIHVIRTNRLPFVQSRASWPLIATTAVIVAVGVLLPISPIAPALGLVQLPSLYWLLLAATVLGYLVLVQLTRGVMQRRGWI